MLISRMSFLGLRTSQLKCEVNKYFVFELRKLEHFWNVTFCTIFFPTKNKTYRGQVECDGLLISFSFKLFILAIGTWAVFYR